MVNWSIAQQPGAFERSFQSGLQMGEFVRQRREQTQERNALADYARNPGEQSLNALANFRPDIVIQERERVQVAQAQQQQRATAGINEFRPVLQQAMQSPEAWAMARTALGQAGHDISDVPEMYDPQWAQGQLMILNAAEDGSLPTIARELQVAGIDIETPEGQQVLRQVIEGRYATEYTDQEGNVRRQSLFNLPPVGQQAQNIPPPPAGFVMDEPQQMSAPTRQNTPAPTLGANGLPSELTAQQYEALVNESSGNRAAVNDYLSRMGIQVRGN